MAASNLDTQSQPGTAEMVRMLLSFQRPPHLSGEVSPLPSCALGPGKKAPARSGLMSIAPDPGPGEAWELGPSSADHLDQHRALAGAIVEVDQNDLLPGSQRKPAVHDGDRLGRADHGCA